VKRLFSPSARRERFSVVIQCREPEGNLSFSVFDCWVTGVWAQVVLEVQQQVLVVIRSQFEFHTAFPVNTSRHVCTSHQIRSTMNVNETVEKMKIERESVNIWLESEVSISFEIAAVFCMVFDEQSSSLKLLNRGKAN
jgi:hypothetical protein